MEPRALAPDIWIWCVCGTNRASCPCLCGSYVARTKDHCYKADNFKGPFCWLLCIFYIYIYICNLELWMSWKYKHFTLFLKQKEKLFKMEFWSPMLFLNDSIWSILHWDYCYWCHFGKTVIFNVILYQNHLEFLLIPISGPIIIHHRGLEAQVYILRPRHMLPLPYMVSIIITSSKFEDTIIS